jgi:glycosyltransferase involved in cell wall biosynthesis
MLRGHKIVVVMPAYNAARTLLPTHQEIMALGLVDRVVVVDDASGDDTAAVAEHLPDTTFHRHPRNRGYGGNQKTCYQLALDEGADIVVMVHPDYQYTPLLLPSLCELLCSGLFDVGIGSRILGGGAMAGGMPLWRYIPNRVITLAENLLTGAKLSEYHSGYRAFTRRVLETVPFNQNSDDFVFDNQILMQVLWSGFKIGEITCPTKYFPEASSINPWRSVVYGFGCLGAALRYRLAKMGMVRSPCG